MKIKLYLDLYWHAPSRKFLMPCLTIVRYQQSKLRTKEKAYRRLLFAKEMREELSDLAILHRVCIDDRIFSEILPKVPSRELAEHRILTSRD